MQIETRWGGNNNSLLKKTDSLIAETWKGSNTNQVVHRPDLKKAKTPDVINDDKQKIEGFIQIAIPFQSQVCREAQHLTENCMLVWNQSVKIVLQK